MTEATGCRLAIIYYDSHVWTKVCCFPLIVSSVFLVGLKAVRDLIGMLLAHFLVCTALRSQHNDRMWRHTVRVSRLQTVWAGSCWHLGFSGDQAVTHKWRLYKELSLMQKQWRGIKGSDGLFQSIIRVAGYFSVNMLVKKKVVYFWMFRYVNFVEWKEVKWAHFVSSMVN